MAVRGYVNRDDAAALAAEVAARWPFSVQVVELCGDGPDAYAVAVTLSASQVVVVDTVHAFVVTVRSRVDRALDFLRTGSDMADLPSGTLRAVGRR